MFANREARNAGVPAEMTLFDFRMRRLTAKPNCSNQFEYLFESDRIYQEPREPIGRKERWAKPGAPLRVMRGAGARWNPMTIG